MASEIRVDKINSLSGVGTVTLSPTGVDIAGITTVATFKVGTGVTASSDGDIFATGVTTSTTFSGNFSGGTVSGTTGTFTGDVDIADKIIHTGDTNTAIRFPEADTFSVETSGTQRLRVEAAGNVNFANNVNVSGTSTVTGIAQFANTINLTHASAGQNYIYFNEDLQLAKNGTGTRLKIDSSGRTLIGTTTQNNNAKLQVTTDQQVVASFEGTGSSDPQIYLGDDMSSPTDNCIILGYDKADNRGYLTVGGDADTVFQVKNGGDIEIGVGNLKFGTSGKGIDFSATADSSGTATSELLDDYEEGTFAPAFSGDSGSGSYGYARQAGIYQKVGNTVYYSFYITANAVNANASGNTLIVGLPFTTGSGNEYYQGATIGYYAGWNGITPSNALCDVNNTRVYLYKNNTTTNITHSVPTDIQIGTSLIVSGHYMV